LWVFNNRRNAEFEQARLLPFADEPSPPDAQAEPATRSTRP
ncbi:CcoQ/FixQ family Cbb3-type cytochrome c oxidase assembly chaperone, partial [Pseudomonas carnis]|nr:CcoQ/FixQ family Cbb3-type cytochrome c oxidase assembly chaperone [Pseudomonas carnis]